MTILKTNKLAGPGGTNAIDGSVYFQGYVDGVASDYLKIPDSDDLDMGTGDFTFECWARGVEHTGNGDRAMGILNNLKLLHQHNLGLEQKILVIGLQ